MVAHGCNISANKANPFWNWPKSHTFCLLNTISQEIQLPCKIKCTIPIEIPERRKSWVRTKHVQQNHLIYSSNYSHILYAKPEFFFDVLAENCSEIRKTTVDEMCNDWKLSRVTGLAVIIPVHALNARWQAQNNNEKQDNMGNPTDINPGSTHSRHLNFSKSQILGKHPILGNSNNA